MSDDRIKFDGGVVSSRCPRYDLIPAEALTSLAARFELGLEKYKEEAWNSLAPAPDDKEWVINRLTHVIDHAYKAIGKLTGKLPEDGDDDAGAIMWGGATLACYQDHPFPSSTHVDVTAQEDAARGVKVGVPFNCGSNVGCCGFLECSLHGIPSLTPAMKHYLAGVWPITMQTIGKFGPVLPPLGLSKLVEMGYAATTQDAPPEVTWGLTDKGQEARKALFA